MGCTIVLKPRAGGTTDDIYMNANLEDAKAYAEAKRTPENRVFVRTDRGGLWALVPRTRNTGPGRWCWERV
jgi:hypothetical protein